MASSKNDAKIWFQEDSSQRQGHGSDPCGLKLVIIVTLNRWLFPLISLLFRFFSSLKINIKCLDRQCTDIRTLYKYILYVS
jgi:hypothetical protein